jgi:peptidoglycan/LPS O-acetylase OafA/YrhL
MRREMPPVETAGKLMQRHDAGLPGVASLRLALVLAILAFQSIQVSEAYLRTIGSPLWILQALLYPALFTLYGFLLARSVDRHGARAFLLRRAKRLWPALAVVVLASALVMGPLVTTLPRRSYATDPDFALYFLNLVAWPRFVLPAVFQFNNIGTVVNLPLWLSPLVVACLVVTVLTRRGGTALLLATTLVLVAGAAALALLVPNLAGISGLQRYLLDGSGAGVTLAFLLGALAYRLRDRLPIHSGAAVAAAGVLALVALIGNRTWLGVPATYLLLVLPMAYLVLSLAFQLLPLTAQALRLERYLLGFLLFSFPVQQLWIAFGFRQQSFLLNFLLALPSTALLTVPLWHLLQHRFFDPAAADPRFGELASRPLLPMSRRALARNLPRFATFALVSIVLFILAAGVMALTWLAFQPESQGV